MLATLDWLKKLFKSLSNISLLISKLSKNSSTFPVTVSKNNFHIYVCNTCYQLFHHLFDTYLLTLSMLGYLTNQKGWREGGFPSQTLFCLTIHSPVRNVKYCFTKIFVAITVSIFCYSHFKLSKAVILEWIRRRFIENLDIFTQSFPPILILE